MKTCCSVFQINFQTMKISLEGIFDPTHIQFKHLHRNLTLIFLNWWWEIVGVIHLLFVYLTHALGAAFLLLVREGWGLHIQIQTLGKILLNEVNYSFSSKLETLTSFSERAKFFITGVFFLKRVFLMYDHIMGKYQLNLLLRIVET